MPHRVQNEIEERAAGMMFLDLAHIQGDWSINTFGPDDGKGSIGTLKHIIKEAEECIANIEAGIEDPMEYADLIILTLDAARRANIDGMTLLGFGLDKMVINKQRTWPKPVPGEPCEHIKE